MEKNAVKIGGKKYKIGCNLRTRIMYERMCGKFFGEDMHTFEQVVFFFCSLMTFNPDFQMEFEEFMDILTKDETPLGAFFKWEVSYFDQVASLSRGAATDDKKKG